MKNKKGESIRTFYEWWNSIPEELKKASNSDNNNKNSENMMVNSINYILLQTEISKMNDIKPTIDELRYWVYSRQI
jgi:hypothetical protein